MRRVFMALALTLIIVGMVGGPALASDRPAGWVDPDKAVSDDHPWGGETDGADYPVDAKDYSESFSAGITPVDFFIDLFIRTIYCRTVHRDGSTVRWQELRDEERDAKYRFNRNSKYTKF